MIKLEIMNAGDVDEQDLLEMNERISELRQRIYALEEKKRGRGHEGEEVRMLKEENDKLRKWTIELLKRNN